MRADCVFCGIVAGTQPSYPVASDDRAFAFMGIEPPTRGHVLVVPRAHSTDVRETVPDDLTAVVLMAQRLARLITDEVGTDGVNLLTCAGEAAWQSVFHTHLHVVPRYRDDPLVVPWQPGVAGDPDDLAAIAAALRGRAEPTNG